MRTRTDVETWSAAFGKFCLLLAVIIIYAFALQIWGSR